mmetsp:Transcript_19816/g.49126  ORF Transcript_19816/g.49126 Transcript_19816/m.49126 type:complete len:296 (+) Transcript_19816:674-1561(+)
MGASRKISSWRQRTQRACTSRLSMRCPTSAALSSTDSSVRRSDWSAPSCSVCLCSPPHRPPPPEPDRRSSSNSRARDIVTLSPMQSVANTSAVVSASSSNLVSRDMDVPRKSNSREPSRLRPIAALKLSATLLQLSPAAVASAWRREVSSMLLTPGCATSWMKAASNTASFSRGVNGDGLEVEERSSSMSPPSTLSPSQAQSITIRVCTTSAACTALWYSLLGSYRPSTAARNLTSLARSSPSAAMIPWRCMAYMPTTDSAAPAVRSANAKASKVQDIIVESSRSLWSITAVPAS